MVILKCLNQFCSGYSQQWVGGDSMFTTSQGWKVEVIIFKLFFFISFSPFFILFKLLSFQFHLIFFFFFLILVQLFFFTFFLFSSHFNFYFLKSPLSALSSLTSCWCARIWRMPAKTTGLIIIHSLIQQDQDSLCWNL